MDREVASHLAFDLSLGARLSFARMVGTEPLVRPMRLLEWGLFIKGRGCRTVIKILLSFHSFRKGQASGLAIPDDQARQANHAIQLLQKTLECSLILLAFFANLIQDPPAPMPKQLSARRSEQRSFPGSKLVRREVTFGFLSRGAGRKAR